MNERQHHGAWWRRYDLGVDEAAEWTIGPLQFWLRRSRSEWRLAFRWLDGEGPDGWQFRRSAEVPADGVEIERFAVSETAGGVRLRTLPPARTVVARPVTPLRVLPGQRTRVFLSSPLSVEICVGDDSAVLLELPTRRLSDTWLGATTREGELAYALKTCARTSLAEMPRAHYRLLTPVEIENRAGTTLRVERLNLPVPFLSIYGAEAGDAWSEEVRLVCREDGDMAELDVQGGAPPEAGAATKLSGPRQVAAKGHLFRAFGSLLGLD